MTSLLVYSLTNSTIFPGKLLGSLNVTRRWPSWEIQPTSSDTYEIYYTTINPLNQTYLVKTQVNITNTTLITTVSDDFGRSCQPSSAISIEITDKFIIMKCNDLHIYHRETMRILAITKFPTTLLTFTIDLGQ